MSLAVDVVKHGKRPNEPFDPDKLHKSLYTTCLSIRSLDGVAHDTAQRTTNLVITWLQDKSEITTEDIRKQAAYHMKQFHADAAYIYQHHKQIM